MFDTCNTTDVAGQPCQFPLPAAPGGAAAGQSVSNDASVGAGQTWGLYGDVGARTNPYGSQATEAWAAGATGSTKVAVGVVDSGVDYTHPDLYLNIWLNQNEIPLALRGALSDIDADGLITFRDLNAFENAGCVSDLNANGRIDAGDLLSDARWEDGADQDANGYADDLIGWDFVNNDNDPMDDLGHGTHVAGTIGAMGGNGAGVAGVAWTTQMVVLKFLDARNNGYVSDNIRALDYFTDASRVGAGVDFVATNNSWGGCGYSQALQDAVTRAAQAGIFYVAAAGNNTSNNDLKPVYPANLTTLGSAGYDAVISVAALTSNGKLAGYSDYGAATVDLAAPGSAILSTALGGGYVSMSGTSMATPFVTGALALYAAAHPDASAAEIRAALMTSTAATASLAGKVATGGRLDIGHFLDTVIAPPPAAEAAAPSAPAWSPTAGLQILGGADADQLIATIFDDTLSGLAGDDTLDGGAGADCLIGGADDDLYVVDATDTVVERDGEGVDTIAAAFSYALGADVENLSLTGAAATSGTGNELANHLTGNSGDNLLAGDFGADTLDGGAGDDILDGGCGGDRLIGGAGHDTFVFNRSELHGDVIQDFERGDHIVLRGFSAGSTVTAVAGSSTAWLVTDAASHASEMLHLANGYTLTADDFLFG